MTSWLIKNEDLENWLNAWLLRILELMKDEDLIVTNDIEGTYNSPSIRKKYFRTAGFAITPDALKTESISPFFNAVNFAFYFMPKGTVNHK